MNTLLLLALDFIAIGIVFKLIHNSNNTKSVNEDNNEYYNQNEEQYLLLFENEIVALANRFSDIEDKYDLLLMVKRHLLNRQDIDKDIIKSIPEDRVDYIINMIIESTIEDNHTKQLNDVIRKQNKNTTKPNNFNIDSSSSTSNNRSRNMENILNNFYSDDDDNNV